MEVLTISLSLAPLRSAIYSNLGSLQTCLPYWIFFAFFRSSGSLNIYDDCGAESALSGPWNTGCPLSIPL